MIPAIAVIMIFANTACGDDWKLVTIVNKTGQTIDVLALVLPEDSIKSQPPAGTKYQKESNEIKDLPHGQSSTVSAWYLPLGSGKDDYLVLGIMDSESSELIKWINVTYQEAKDKDFTIEVNP